MAMGASLSIACVIGGRVAVGAPKASERSFLTDMPDLFRENAIAPRLKWLS